MLILDIKYKKRGRSILSPSELKDLYFFGVPLIDQQGNVMSDQTISTYIQSAQEEIEHYLDIKLNKQIFKENLDFSRSDWMQWGFLRTTYPVNEVFTLNGFVNKVQQVQVPNEWLSIKKASRSNMKFRQVHVVAVGSTIGVSHNMIYNGVAPFAFLNNAHIPNYWEVEYCTGFDVIPKDLLNFIGKLAAVNIFHIMGDLILGAGIASQSIGIDGLSQSISTTSSATNAGYGARVGGYLDDLKNSLPKIEGYYKGYQITAL